MLHIEGLSAEVFDQLILNGINLQLNTGELHVIMGPNGSGKSTLAETLVGRKDIKVSGKALFKPNLQKDKTFKLLDLPVDVRSKMGIFLAFQNPPEIEGLSLTNLIKASVDSQREFMGLDKINSTKFLDRLYKYSNLLGLDKEFLSRFVGVGMSGGEKKRSEMLQLAMMDPKIAILDEIDSGVDVDSVAVIISAIKELRNKNRSWIVITHYGSFAQSLEPDFVHILIDGKIVHSGGVGTLEKLENGGFEQFR